MTSVIKLSWLSSKHGLVVAFSWPDSVVSRWALWIKLYIWVISHLDEPWTSPWPCLCIWDCVCKCESVCVGVGERPSHANTAYSISLAFFPSLSPLHFHVYRLGLMVCILTISVWKPADSPALWAWQGCRFIREGGSYLLHQFSWYKFAIFLFGYVATRQMHSHFRSAGLPVLIPVHNTAAAAELSG